MSHKGKMRRGEKNILRDGHLAENLQDDVNYFKENSKPVVEVKKKKKEE